MIEGVEFRSLKTYSDDRGFFREVLKASDIPEGFGQLNWSLSYTGTIKAWHIHQKQTDYWICTGGVIRAVLYDLRPLSLESQFNDWATKTTYDYYIDNYKPFEFLLGDNQPAQILKIPPGVTHGYKVLQGPATLFYVTTQEYDPDDEGRISYDALGYDWFKQVIK